MENSKQKVENLLEKIDRQVDGSLFRIAQSFISLEESHDIAIIRRGNNYIIKLLISGHMRTDVSFYQF